MQQMGITPGQPLVTGQVPAVVSTQPLLTDRSSVLNMLNVFFCVVCFCRMRMRSGRLPPGLLVCVSVFLVLNWVFVWRWTCLSTESP